MIKSLYFYAASLLEALDNPDAAGSVAEAGEKLAPALDSTAKLLGPKMIILSGYLGTNDTYFGSVKDALEREFDHNPETSFQLKKGAISSVEAAALLALHAFCYSDRLDYDRFAQASEQSKGLIHG